MFKKILILASLIAFMCAKAYGGTVFITEKQRTTFGNKRVVMGVVHLIGPYSGTAFSFTPRTVGLNKIERIMFWPNDISTATHWIPFWTTGDRYITLSAVFNNQYKPDITPGSSDSLKVTCKAFVTGGADTSVVFVSTLGGSLNAFLGAIGASVAPSSSITLTDPYAYMADSATSICVVGDTAMTYPQVRLRGKLTCADTVWFDYNGANRTNRLYYSGSVMGNMGDLYIPINYTGATAASSEDGRYIKIRKATNSAITGAGMHPLHFIHASTIMDEKFIIDLVGTRNITCGALVDTTYTSLPFFAPLETTPRGSSPIDGAWQFVIIGN